jgi:hypothetical protein
MKNSIIALVVMAVLAIAGSSFAQGNTASATGTANATIICPITLTAGTISFGNLVGGTGLVSMDNTGAITYGGNTSPGTQGGSHSAATWTVGGQGGWLYNVTDDGTRAYTLSDGAGHTITGNANAPSGSNARTLAGEGCSGTGSFTQGGTANLTGQPAGVYSTTLTGGSGWSETVTYN